MDYSFIIRQLQVLINNNRISFIPIAFIVINLLIFIISRTFRKTGLFVLALAFGLDYAIKSMPFDLYLNYPELYNAVTVLYVIGFIIFFYKVLKMVIRISNAPVEPGSKAKSKLGQFLSFTGLGPFLFMLLVNIVDINNVLPQKPLNIITSLAFLYMLVRTIHSTYNYLRSKESIVLAGKMDFSEIKEFLNEDGKSPKSNSKNQGRQVRKTLEKPTVEEPTEVISKRDIDQASRIKVADISKDERIIKVKESNNEANDSQYSKLSNTDLIKIVAADFDKSNNETTISITNLNTSEHISYTSKRPKFSIHEEDEYKIDLEFETINEYDYGRFIDILLLYSKNKDLYKFELIVKPMDVPSSKIIFYDPSNIYDIDESDYANVGGKIISLNFPKYKINFITGN